MVMETMPDRGRDLQVPGSEEAARYVEMLHREGTLACTEAGCEAATGVACAYVDRRLHRCSTAWCPAHRYVLGREVFCRRHAGVVSALSSGEAVPTTTSYPDLNNRAPSLVAWMARALDADVWGLLLEELGTETGGQLVADPVTLVFHGVQRGRSWERAWKLVTHTGVARRVSVLVEEADDTTVVVKVGSRVVTSVVPPWIAHRSKHEDVSPEVDAGERAAFNQQLIAAIGEGLRSEAVRENEAWHS